MCYGTRSSEIVMCDVGLSKRCCISRLKSRIPTAALPRDMPAGLRKRVSRRCKPDALVLKIVKGVHHYEKVKSNTAGTPTPPNKKKEPSANPETGYHNQKF